MNATRFVLAPLERTALGATLTNGGNRPWSTAATGQEPTWPADVPISWSSSNPSVLTVSGDGVVEARAAGQAVVTLRAAGIEDTTTVFVRPQSATGGPVAVLVTAGSQHTCALTVNGVAYCWGDAWLAQVGGGLPRQFTKTLSPVPVVGGGRYVTIDAGDLHTCALDQVGTAYCWGDGAQGQIGDGARAIRGVPSKVRTEHAFVAITAGGDHSCGLTASGTAVCWGSRVDTAPTGLPNDRFSVLTAGGTHRCGLATSGVAYCWGDNSFGQLGTGDRISRASPAVVAGGRRFQRISAGVDYTCAVTTESEAYCWGEGVWGKLGNGSENTMPVPTRVAGTTRWLDIDAGGTHTCAIASTRRAYCWGQDVAEQLGDGLSTLVHPSTSDLQRTEPTAVVGGLTFASVAVGSLGHTCGRTTAGSLYCWGSNGSGAVGSGKLDWSAAGVLGWSVAVPVRVAYAGP